MLRAPLLGFTLLLGASCTPSSAAAPQGGPPPGEVWLAADEIRSAGITTVPVADRDVDDVLMAAGRISFNEGRISHVSSPVSGRVVRIDGALGEHVTRGQTLAVIRSPDLADATSALAKADADLIATEHAFRRSQELRAGGGASDATVEQAEDGWRSAKAEAERAREKVALFHAGRAVSDSYPLLSPIEGTVLARTVTPGFEVQGAYSGGTMPDLFTVGDLDEVWVFAQIYETDLARVHAGEPVEVSVDGIAHSYVGKVDYVADMLDAQTRTAPLRCSIANPDHMLKPEMYGTVRVAVAPVMALAIPREAVQHLAGQAFVFVQQGAAPNGRTRFERLPVVVDLSGSAPFVRVQHGLDPGQQVVSKGAEALSLQL